MPRAVRNTKAVGVHTRSWGAGRLRLWPWHDALVVPLAVKRGAEAFGLDPDRLVALGGNSGSSWGSGDRVLRVGQRLDEEIRAVSAAAGVLPVPRVLDRTDFGAFTAALMERLPGQPAGEVAMARPELAHAIGRACGALHARLAQIPAPAGLRVVGTRELLPHPCLLHLDLHPFNVLVDDAATVTGVIDWANAAGGEPVLDRARTWSILMLDPAALARGSHPGWRTLIDAWTSQAALRNLPARARVWACEFMLGDLARRYPAEALKHVVHALAAARTQSAG
jgi:aminoglycoside phosphotransferase (APT) family kinase protein